MKRSAASRCSASRPSAEIGDSSRCSVDAEQVARAAVRVLDAQVAVDQQHALVEPFEQPLEPVAVLLERVEELLQLAAHALDRPGEAADLVGEAVVGVDAEVALADRLRGAGDPREPARDQRRDQQPERRADREREQRRLQELVAHDAELLAQLRAQRVGDDGAARAAVELEADDERRAVAAAGDVAVAGERRAQRLAAARHADQLMPCERSGVIGRPFVSKTKSASRRRSAIAAVSRRSSAIEPARFSASVAATVLPTANSCA